VYGKVYKGVERSSGDTVAMKRINFNVSDGVPSSSLREVALLKSLRHPNVVNLRDVMYVGDNKIYMIMDYVESDLKMFIKGRENRDEATNLRYTQSYLYQLLRAVNFCHFNRILHRDIKPANILLDLDGNLKLADFGLGRCFNVPMMKMTHEVVTLYYRAPEILLSADYYSMPVDMWSVGTIFAEMVCTLERQHSNTNSNTNSRTQVTGNPLFKGNSEIDALFRIFRTLGTPTDKIWPGVSSFKNYKAEWFPKWFAQTLEKFVPGLRQEGMFLFSFSRYDAHTYTFADRCGTLIQYAQISTR